MQYLGYNLRRGTYKSWGKTGYYMLHDTPIAKIEWANRESKLVSAVKSKIDRSNPYDYGEKNNHKSGVSLDDIKYLVIRAVTDKMREIRHSPIKEQVSKINQFLESQVREIRTPGSVGVWVVSSSLGRI